MSHHLPPIEKILKNTVNRLQRRITIAMLTVRVVAALGRALDAAIRVLLRIPQWVYTLAVGLMWLLMAVVGIGKGQDWAVFCAFLGMLWWALQEKNFADLLHDHARAIAGWSEAVNAMVAASQRKECEHKNLPVKYDPADCFGKDEHYVRENYPRFHGPCPDCGEVMIGYASEEHYYAGDW